MFDDGKFSSLLPFTFLLFTFYLSLCGKTAKITP